MSEMLYDTFKEYARIEEEVALTEEGLYLKDEVPEKYGGYIMQVKVAHTIHMINSAGHMLTLEFHNPIPMDKDKNECGPVTVDGEAPESPANGVGLPTTGTARTWTTVLSTQLVGKAKDAASFTVDRRSKPEV